MTLREAARLLFWTRPSDKRVFHLRVAGGAAGLTVAAIEFPSPPAAFIAASFALGMLGGVLGSAVGLVLMLCGYGRSCDDTK
jgi:hypothetical protein